MLTFKKITVKKLIKIIIIQAHDIIFSIENDVYNIYYTFYKDRQKNLYTLMSIYGQLFFLKYIVMMSKHKTDRKKVYILYRLATHIFLNQSL